MEPIAATEGLERMELDAGGRRYRCLLFLGKRLKHWKEEEKIGGKSKERRRKPREENRKRWYIEENEPTCSHMYHTWLAASQTCFKHTFNLKNPHSLGFSMYRTIFFQQCLRGIPMVLDCRFCTLQSCPYLHR